jgi:hypothetical protein
MKADRMRIAGPGFRTFDLSKTGAVAENLRDFTWTGNAIGPTTQLPGSATFVVRGDDVTGSITNSDGLYRIAPLGSGMHALIKVDTTKLPRDEPPSFQQKEKKKKPNGSPGALDLRPSQGLTQIDVLVAYTPAAKAALTDINATIALAVKEANASYAQSNIQISLNMVDSFQVNYTESKKTFDKILADFVAMSDVKKRRDSSGADLAALIIDNAAYCGLADDILAKAATAFAVVYYDCATGYYSFAHELGHLMGARHNEQVDPTSAPFAYGHGFRHDSSPSFRTIMSYDCAPAACTRLQFWSNPDISYQAVPMGNAATNNNARVLNSTRAIIAGFRSSSTPATDASLPPGAARSHP